MNNNEKVKMRGGEKTEYGCQKRKTSPNNSIRNQDTQINQYNKSILFAMRLLYVVFKH